MNKADPFWDPFFFDEHRLTNEQWEELLNPYPGKIIDIGNPIRGLPTFWSAVHPSFIPSKEMRMNTIKELENELTSIEARTKVVKQRLALLKNEHLVTTVPVHVNSTTIREGNGGPSAFTWMVNTNYGLVRLPIDMMTDKHLLAAIDWIHSQGNESHKISLSYMLRLARERGLR